MEEEESKYDDAWHRKDWGSVDLDGYMVAPQFSSFVKDKVFPKCPHCGAENNPKLVRWEAEERTAYVHCDSCDSLYCAIPNRESHGGITFFPRRGTDEQER